MATMTLKETDTYLKHSEGTEKKLRPWLVLFEEVLIKIQNQDIGTHLGNIKAKLAEYLDRNQDEKMLEIPSAYSYALFDIGMRRYEAIYHEAEEIKNHIDAQLQFANVTEQTCLDMLFQRRGLLLRRLMKTDRLKEFARKYYQERMKFREF